jgi:hypothetical protein
MITVYEPNYNTISKKYILNLFFTQTRDFRYLGTSCCTYSSLRNITLPCEDGDDDDDNDTYNIYNISEDDCLLERWTA